MGWALIAQRSTTPTSHWRGMMVCLIDEGIWKCWKFEEIYSREYSADGKRDFVHVIAFVQSLQNKMQKCAMGNC